MLSLVFDGTPLGEHRSETDKERAKRVYEKESLAYALVGCKVDLEIAEIRSLEPDNQRPTADFEATLRDSKVVRIELARLIDPAEKVYFNVLSAIVQRARDILSSTEDADGIRRGGRFVVQFRNQKPQPRDIPEAGAELADFVLRYLPSKEPSATLWPADGRWSTMNRLGGCVAHLDEDGPTFLSADAMRIEANTPGTLARFEVMSEQKKRNFASYSEGKPVWLVFYSDTRLFFPLALVDRLSGVETFDPQPFERVMLGCFTAGVVFDRPYTRPRYSSLSSG